MTSPTANTAEMPPRELNSNALFDGQRELHIRHGGEQYRLRITRSGKLILTK
ncbi:MAG: hemin uptake protein HemP [Gammaproteobacteria bacterium]|nr:hemin uptake protein HemP [Gammaproteobacteria bacterium]MCP5137068.1 hemin uptake protein HemP [Gammaproteobacteria bacterium]